MSRRPSGCWSGDQFLILTHLRPDGDTIGCAAGLCRALRQIGKTAYVLETLKSQSCLRIM